MNTAIDKQTAEHYIWGNNCDSWVLANTEGLSVKQEKMPSGAKEQLHFHAQAQQLFYILKGSATFYINNEATTVNEKQAIQILPNQKHFIANETSDELEFLVISQPSTNKDRTVVE